MVGLVSYASSDEEDNVEGSTRTITAVENVATAPTNGHANKEQITQIKPNNHEPSEVHEPLPLPIAPVQGPILAPEASEGLVELDSNIPPQSPYSVNRALLRDLTLPTIPNYDIPPSPPGSPMESTNAKFKHFLELKKQGVHFNEKLAKSSALKNPSLMQKLMDFSGIDDLGQYESTLSKECWEPKSFPALGYKEELAKSQQKMLKKKEDDRARGQRESVEFVPASVQSGDRGSALSSKVSQKSAAERVMAGLDRGRSSSPQVGTKRKTRFES